MRLSGSPVLALLALGAALWLLLDPQAGHQVYPERSRHAHGAQGFSLAAAWLQAQGVSVQDLRVRGGQADLPAGSLLLRLDAPLAADADLDGTDTDLLAHLPEHERAWLAAGNRLLWALPQADSRSASVAEARACLPAWPTLPAARRRVCALPNGGHSLLLHGDGLLLGRVPVGAGELLVLADPDLLSNAELGEPGHLELLARLRAGASSIAFDELAHGRHQQLEPVSLLRCFGLAPAMAVGLLALVLHVWRSRRSIGPADPPPVRRQREAVDLVESLAGLYRQQLRSGEQLHLALDLLRARCGRQRHLRGQALEQAMTELLHSQPPPVRVDLSHNDMKQWLRRLAQAHRRLDDERHQQHR